MKKPKKLLALLLAIIMTASALTACGKPESAPSETVEEDIDRALDDSLYHVVYKEDGVYTVSFTRDDLVTEKEGRKAPDLSKVTQEDVKVFWQKNTTPESDEPVEPTFEERNAAINDFINKDGVITLTFSDKEAAKDETRCYTVVVKEKAALLVSADPVDYLVVSNVESVNCFDEQHEITLSLDSGSFSPNVSAKDIKLGNSFKGMKVEKVSASGKKMDITLSGSPVIDPEVCSVYTDGEIRLEGSALENTPFEESVYIPVAVPMVGVDLSELEENGNTVTFPIEVQGMDGTQLTAADVEFDGEGKVTDVQVEGDRVLVTVQAPKNDTSGISGDLTVGDASMVISVTHASVNTVFDYIEQDGDDLLITLKVSALNGTFSNSFGAGSFALAMDFSGGSVESVKKTDSSNADVVIRFPANGMSDENYKIDGQFELAEGALTDENGTPAPAFTFARQYVPEEMGRLDLDVDIICEIDGSPIKKKDVAAIKEMTKYGKQVYSIVSNAISGKWGDVFSGAKTFLKMVGLIKEVSNPGVTNEDLMKEIKTIQTMLDNMSAKLDENIKQTYQNRIVVFENALGAIEIDSKLIEPKLEIARKALAAQGVTVADNANDKEASEYTAKLIDYCKAQERAGNGDFQGFTFEMQQLETNFKTVATEAAKEAASSPFYAFDGYWDMYFNWHSQSYYLRASYYAKCSSLITRAYGLLSLYYNIPAHQESYQALTDSYIGAMKSIESRSLGKAPTDTRYTSSTGIYDGITYSPTLKFSSAGVHLNWDPCDYRIAIIDDVNMIEYRKRLHGHTLVYDLVSAGLLLPDFVWSFSLASYGSTKVPLINTIGLASYNGGPYDTGWYKWPHDHHRGYDCHYYYWGDASGPYRECYYDTDPGDSDHNFDYFAFLYRCD